MPLTTNQKRARHKTYLKNPYSLFEENKFKEAYQATIMQLKKYEEEQASPYYQAKAHQLIARCILEDIKSNPLSDISILEKFAEAKSKLLLANSLFSQTERLNAKNIYVTSCKQEIAEVQTAEILTELFKMAPP